METLTCRLLPYAVADGPHNMAADEALLESAAAGVASLRFYGWTEATVSLGYFQPERLRREAERLASLPFVRRPSGGNTLVHHHEITYVLALPRGAPWQTGESRLRRMHAIIAAGLAQFGIRARLFETGNAHEAAILCFQHFTPGDLLVGSCKIVGSAQRRQRGALMQHGGILLAGSHHAPALSGILELTGRRLETQEAITAIVGAFARYTGWDVVPGDWTDAENERKEELVTTKYSQEIWNRKR